MNQKEKISRSRKNGSALLPSGPEYSGGFQNAECDFMDVEIGRINGQVRRFLVKIMPFIHEMFQHGLGIGLLEQGAVGASGNTLVQDGLRLYGARRRSPVFSVAAGFPV